MRKKWYHNLQTKEERLFKESPENDDWILGRLPSSYWDDDKKKSYSEKRKNIEWSDEYRSSQRERSRRYQTDRVGYTDGIHNIWLRIGQDVPCGFYRGWTITEPYKYWRTEKKIECLRQLMEGQP